MMLATHAYRILMWLCDYKCAGCEIKGVRMWRKPHMTQTLCAACSLAEQRDQLEHYRAILPDQMYPYGPLIGDRIPAIPDVDGTMWGHTSAPEAAVKWWDSLPDNHATVDGLSR